MSPFQGIRELYNDTDNPYNLQYINFVKTDILLITA